MVKKWFRNLVYAGFVAETSADIRKQILVSSIFSQISIILFILYGIDNFGGGDSLLSFIVFLCAAISGINYLFLRKTGRFQIASVIIVLLMILLCLYLLCSGGSDNTGPLWFFVLPSLAFYILGLQRGIIILLALLSMVLYILYVPENSLLQTIYPAAFVKRFTGALFSVSILAFVYEYSREDGRKELLSLSRKLDLLSRKDELTGISNRRDIIEKIQDELSRFERTGHTFSILLADIDHFKRVNDTFGHECGDDILRKIAGVFSTNTQKRDSVARWGGEEFLVFLPETTGQQARKTAERLRAAVEAILFDYNGRPIPVTTSIGVAEFRSGQTVNQSISTADTFLYRAKTEGRNRIAGPIT